MNVQDVRPHSSPHKPLDVQGWIRDFPGGVDYLKGHFISKGTPCIQNAVDRTKMARKLFWKRAVRAFRKGPQYHSAPLRSTPGVGWSTDGWGTEFISLCFVVNGRQCHYNDPPRHYAFTTMSHRMVFNVLAIRASN